MTCSWATSATFNGPSPALLARAETPVGRADTSARLLLAPFPSKITSIIAQSAATVKLDSYSAGPFNSPDRAAPSGGAGHRKAFLQP